MSRTSRKENKTIYQTRREDLGLSREKASELTCISENRIENIELEKTKATPEDIVAMAKAYNMPELCNNYCVNECAIGRNLNISLTERKGLAKIVLEVLTTLNLLDQEKNRLIEIAADEMISEDELADFTRIQSQLEKIVATADSLNLWISNAINEGTIDKEKLASIVSS